MGRWGRGGGGGGGGVGGEGGGAVGAEGGLGTRWRPVTRIRIRRTFYLQQQVERWGRRGVWAFYVQQ